MKPIFCVVALILIATIAFAQKNNKHAIFEKTKQQYQLGVAKGCDSAKSHYNDKQAKERIDFLNKDFKTKLFDKYNSVAYWYCDAVDNDGEKANFQVISIYFQNENSLSETMKKIKASKRTNFLKKELSIFKTKPSKRELVIISTAATKNKRILGFLNHF